jgi:hypothetical protein
VIDTLFVIAGIVAWTCVVYWHAYASGYETAEYRAKQSALLAGRYRSSQRGPFDQESM